MKDDNRKEAQSGPLNIKFLILSSQITVKRESQIPFQCWYAVSSRRQFKSYMH